ncbi:metal-dependent hydrolase [Tractidigestivibacter sp.]|jgi:inner membrane protein|uniref:metal-dependent hydrolase n=1 Tax=Tractidigestivibacter sp. TaxID=2847320 RepID=UPI003FD7ACD6
MTGKTHIAVGAAAALVVAKYVPAALTAGVPTIAGDASALACLAAGAAGGLLPDTDVSTSEASRQLRRAWWLLVAVIAATFAADALLGLDLGAQTVAFVRAAGVYQVAGIAVIVAVLACGRASGHRGFSHSLVAAVLFFGGAYLAVPEIALALTVGYFSHLVIDLLNKMPERLFWPVAKGQSLGLCKSAGVVDGALLVLGVVAVVALLAGWL